MNHALANPVLWLLGVALGAAAVMPAAAADWQFHVAAGRAYPVQHESAAVYEVGVERAWREYYGGQAWLDLTLLGVEARSPQLAGLNKDVQALAVGVRWRRNGWLLGFSPALATARTDAVSGVVQFLSTLGYEWKHVGLLLQHISNASTNGRNYGETMLMLEARFGAD